MDLAAALGARTVAASFLQRVRGDEAAARDTLHTLDTLQHAVVGLEAFAWALIVQYASTIDDDPEQVLERFIAVFASLETRAA
jgi:hypothetical protein